MLLDILLDGGCLHLVLGLRLGLLLSLGLSLGLLVSLFAFLALRVLVVVVVGSEFEIGRRLSLLHRRLDPRGEIHLLLFLSRHLRLFVHRLGVHARGANPLRKVGIFVGELGVTDAARPFLALTFLLDLVLRLFPLFAFDSSRMFLLEFPLFVVPVHLLPPARRFAFLELALKRFQVFDVGLCLDNLACLVHDGHRGVGGFGGEKRLFFLVEVFILGDGLEVGGGLRGSLERGHGLELGVGLGRHGILLSCLLLRLLCLLGDVLLDDFFHRDFFLDDFFRHDFFLDLLRGGGGLPLLSRDPLALQRGPLEFHRAGRHLTLRLRLGIDGRFLFFNLFNLFNLYFLGWRRSHGRLDDVVLDPLLLRHPLTARVTRVRADELVDPGLLDETRGHPREFLAPIAREPDEPRRIQSTSSRRLRTYPDILGHQPGSTAARPRPPIRGVPERGVVAAYRRVLRGRPGDRGVGASLRGLVREPLVEVVTDLVLVRVFVGAVDAITRHGYPGRHRGPGRRRATLCVVP